jgi:GNAT superfamily N-acetyltransferase
MIEYALTSRLTDVAMTRSLLDSLEVYYPEFGYWYTNQCIPGIMTGPDKLLVAKDAGRVIGIALGKVSSKETKLRCVRVLPDYQNKGVGLHLIERMLRHLDHDKPYCTVAEEMLHLYSRAFVNLFQFSLDEVNKGMYRQNKLEYCFNVQNHTDRGG